jgi:PilZ domain
MDQNTTTWLDIVGVLAIENAPVRISFSDRPVEEGGRYARVRVLGLGTDGGLLIEEPGVRVLGDRPQPGDKLDILAVRQQTRLVGRCRVIGHEEHALNETVRVAACRVSPPIKAFSGQMREFYRAPVTAGVKVPSVLLTLDPNDTEAMERMSRAGEDNGKAYKARLVNISGGGVGLALIVDKLLVRIFKMDTACTLRAELPVLDEPLEQSCRIVHTQKLENGDLYLGVAFEFEDSIRQLHVEDQLQRLSVWLQRQMLKRERQD